MAGGTMTTTANDVDTATIRLLLDERLTELRAEYDELTREIVASQRQRLADSAGDDEVDSGTKTFEHGRELAVARSLRERIVELEEALVAVEDGAYGSCAGCGHAIPPERLAVYPAATLCVTCKQATERLYAA